jgi:hypothetical protein
VNKGFREKVNTKRSRIGIVIHSSEWFSKESFLSGE